VSSHTGTEAELHARLRSTGTHTPTDPVSDLERAALEWANESPTATAAGPFRELRRDLPDGFVRLVTDGERVRLAQVVRTSPDGGLGLLEVACRGAAATGGPGGLPVPAGLKPIAVRVGLDGRATAALAGPAPAETAVAAWKADGWSVAGSRVFRLTRRTEAAIVWAIPEPKGRDESFFLIAPARAGVNPNPGSSR
jgi:hypothetical protein